MLKTVHEVEQIFVHIDTICYCHQRLFSTRRTNTKVIPLNKRFRTKSSIELL